MTAEYVCVNFKFGFCKYGVRCRRKHINIKCENQECDIVNCERRHPYECRFYRDFKRCKFGNYCMYDHIDHIDPVMEELKLVKIKLDLIEKEIKEKNKDIKLVLEKLDKLLLSKATLGFDHVIGPDLSV